MKTINISDILKEKENPKTAYVFNDQSISYGELITKALKYSDLLSREGTSPVLIYGSKRAAVLISMFACIFSRRTYIPVEKGTPVFRIEQIIASSGAGLILSEEKTLIASIPSLTLDELEIYKDESAKKSSENDVIYIIFTSGSSGEPKGVPITRQNLENFINWISDLIPLNEYRSIGVLNTASFSFDLSVADIFYSLYNGHTLTAVDRSRFEEAGYLSDLIRRSGVSVVVATPTFIKLCLTDPDFNGKNFSFLKCMYFCGEILDKKTVKKIFERFEDVTIINAYGPTEATSAVSAVKIERGTLNAEDELPIGVLSSSAVEITIDDGEIILKGKSVFDGYLNSKEKIEFYRTGDIGYEKDGLLYYAGRKDRQIKYGGYRIELDDVEKNINDVRGVKDCAVISKRNPNNTVKLIKAFVILENGVNTEYVKNELKKVLPYYMIPKIIKEIDSLPINKNGKTDRKALENL